MASLTTNLDYYPLHQKHPFAHAHSPTLGSSTTCTSTTFASVSAIPELIYPSPPSTPFSDQISILPRLHTPPAKLRKIPSTSTFQSDHLPSNHSHRPPHKGGGAMLHLRKSRKPTSPISPTSPQGSSSSYGKNESFLPFGGSSETRRRRKSSFGNSLNQQLPLSPISPQNISSPSSTIRLSSDPAKASVQLGYRHGLAKAPEMPSIHGMMDFLRWDTDMNSSGSSSGPASSSGHRPVHSSINRDPSSSSYDTGNGSTSKRGKRDTLQLPMMSIQQNYEMPTIRESEARRPHQQIFEPDNRPARRYTQTQPQPHYYNQPYIQSGPDGEVDMSDWDIVSVKSAPSTVLRSKRSSRSLNPSVKHSLTPSPAPTYRNFSDWVDPDTPSPSQHDTPTNEVNLRALEVLEHFSGHLLKDGWGEELEGFIPQPAPLLSLAPPIPPRSYLRRELSEESVITRRQRPSPVSLERESRSSGRTQDDDFNRSRTRANRSSTVTNSSTRQDSHLRNVYGAQYEVDGDDKFDAGSMRSWREARKKTKPQTPKVPDNPTSQVHLKGTTDNRNEYSLNRPRSPRSPTSSFPSLRKSSLTPVYNSQTTAMEDTSMVDSDITPRKQGIRRLSAGMSRRSQRSLEDTDKKAKVKVPLVLDPRALKPSPSASNQNVISPPTSPVPIHLRPLPPVPQVAPGSTKAPSRANSAGPTALFRLNGNLLRPKKGRPSTSTGIPSERSKFSLASSRNKLEAREEPSPRGALSPRLDASLKRRNGGYSALSFLAMDEDDPLESFNPELENRSKPSSGVDGNGIRCVTPIVEHILPPEELSRITSASRPTRRASMSSADSHEHLQTLNADDDPENARDGAGVDSPIRQVSDERDQLFTPIEKKASKTDYRKSTGQASMTLSLNLSPSSYSMYPSPEMDDPVTLPTALPPPPRPRNSITSRRCSNPKVNLQAISMSTPPLPDPSSQLSPSSSLTQRPLTFMATSSSSGDLTPNTPISMDNSLSSLQSSTSTPLDGPGLASRRSSVRRDISNAPTPSPMSSIFGHITQSNHPNEAPEIQETDSRRTSLRLQSRRNSVMNGEIETATTAKSSLTSGTGGSGMTGQRDAERDKALREWLKSKPKRGTISTEATTSGIVA